MKCPCCLQEVIVRREVLISLDTNAVSFRGRTLKLTGRQAEIISVLAQRAPIMTTTSYIIEQVWGVGEEENTVNTLKVYVCGLRHAIAPLGLNIKTIRGRGYALEMPPELSVVA